MGGWWSATNDANDNNAAPQAAGVVTNITSITNNNTINNNNTNSTVLSSGNLGIAQGSALWAECVGVGSDAVLPPVVAVGREQQIASIEEALSKGGLQCFVAISGEGGTGKTTLASIVMHRVGKEYDVVRWLKADSISSVTASIMQLGYEWQLPLSSLATDSERVRAVMQRLQQSKRVLLVYDNVEQQDIATLQQQKYLPQATAGSVQHIMMTTRSSDIPSEWHVVKVDVFSDNEVVELVSKRIGKCDATVVCELGSNVGNLPFAVDFALSHVIRKKISLLDFVLTISKWKNEKKDAIDGLWMINIESLSPEAVEVMTLCGMMDPDRIPRIVLVELCDGDDEVVVDLVNRSLLTLVDDGTMKTLKMHRLLHEVVKRRLVVGEAAMRVFVKGGDVVREMMDKEDDDNRHYFVFYRSMIDVARQCRSMSAFNTSDDDDLDVRLTKARLMMKDADFMQDYEQRFSSGLSVLSGAMSLLVGLYGSDEAAQIDVCVCHDRIGQMLRSAGKYKESLVHLEKSMRIDVKLYGEDSRNVAISLHNIGRTQRLLGKYDDAFANLERSLAIRTKLSGDESVDVANCLTAIGAVLQKQQKYDDAISKYSKALAIYTKICGEDDVQVANVYNNIAGVLQLQGKLDDALANFNKSLAIKMKVYGENHINTSNTFRNMGMVYREQGKHDEAIAHYERALATRRKIHGEEHEDVADTLFGIALVRMERKQFDEAIRLFTAARAIYEKCHHGGRDNDVWKCNANISTCQSKQQ